MRHSDELEFADRALGLVEPWIIRAAAALLTLWNEDFRYFDRDSTTSSDDTWDRIPFPEKGRVSTALATSALIDYLRVYEEGFDTLGDTPDPNRILAGDRKLLVSSPKPTPDIVRSVICEAGSQLETWEHDGFDNHQSLHYVLSVAASATYRHALLSRHNDDCKSSKTSAMAAANRMHMRVDSELWAPHRNPVNAAPPASFPPLARHGNDPEDEPSYYVTFEVLRTHDLCRLSNAKDENSIWDLMGRLVSRDLQAQIGHNLGQVGPQSTAADLVFASAILDRLEEENAQIAVDRALAIVLSRQNADGSWPSPPCISRDEGVFQASTFDLAYGITCLLLNRIGQEQWSQVPEVLRALDSAFEYVRFHKETVRAAEHRTGASFRSFLGWQSDGSRQRRLVAAYETARVLGFLVRYRDALLAYRQHLVLERYSVFGRPAPRETLWADLATAGVPTDEASDPLALVRDPIDGRRLVDSIRSGLIAPIEDSPYRRPAKDRRSFLLLGPPGTGKTSLMRRIAERLDWPLIVLTPPDFLSDGLAAVQSVASRIFEDLLRVRRAVVLFDECEELFRARGLFLYQAEVAADHIDSTRTDSAFLTSGMLPWLQRLHDRRWVLYALATNVPDVSDPQVGLDPAALRAGRFDRRVLLPHPMAPAREYYMARRLGDLALGATGGADDERVAVSEIAKEVLDEYLPSKEITWRHLDYLLDVLPRKVQSLNEETIPFHQKRADLRSFFGGELAAQLGRDNPPSIIDLDGSV